jgi:integrase
MVKTSVPGIYACDNRYVVVYRDTDGRQRKKFCLTLAEAKVFKATVTADKARGEIVRPSRITVADYFGEWLPAYRGRTSKGIKEHTKQHYADQMRLHVLPTLGRRRLADLGPRDIKRLAADLRAKGLSENSVRLALAPLRSMCADAFEDEVIRRNPCAGVTVTRPRSDVDEDGVEQAKVKALTPDELARLLAEIPEQHRLLFEVLAVSGLRIGELLALRWRDVDFGRRRLLIRRRWYRGTFAAPKSKYGRRDVPLTETMTQRLWQRRKEARGSDDALVFPSAVGTPLGDANLYKPFKAAAKAAGVPGRVSTPCATPARLRSSGPGSTRSRCRRGSATMRRRSRCEAPDSFDSLAHVAKRLKTSDGTKASAIASRLR